MPTKLDELKELRAKQYERAGRALQWRDRWHAQLRKAGVPQRGLDLLFSCERVAAFVGASTQARNKNERLNEISKCVDVYCAKVATAGAVHKEPAKNVRVRAEQWVRDNGGRWAGYKRLEEELHCSRKALQDAVKRSVYLTARFAEAEDERDKRKGPPKTVAFSRKLEATTGECDAALKELIGDQLADDRSERVRRRL